MPISTNLKKYITVLSVATIVGCNPAHAGLCGNAANLAETYSKMQYANEYLVNQGKEAKYSREQEISIIHNSTIARKYIGVFELVVNFGFDNPTFNNSHYIWKIMYTKCQQWMLLNGLDDQHCTQCTKEITKMQNYIIHMLLNGRKWRTEL